MSFAGLHILSLESRRAQEMEALIRRESGDPFVAPSVEERPIEDHGDLVHFVEQLEAGDFELLICMTGVGLAFLRDVVCAHLPKERLCAALRRVTIVSRGPKPLPVLRDLNVRATVVVPEPNTWKEIVDAIASRAERRIAVQEYGRPNLEMNSALESLGATVTQVSIYRWQLPADVAPLREAARRLAAREVDVVLFTSAIQLEHLLDIARDLGINQDVLLALRQYTVIASVGPVMTSSLEAYGLSPDITPKHPKMGALIRAASDLAAASLAQKRAPAGPVNLSPNS